MINGYRITKDGKVYKTDSELTEIEEVKPYFKKYKKVKLDGISYRVDELLMKTLNIAKILKKKGLPTSFDKKRNFIYKDERITA